MPKNQIIDEFIHTIDRPKLNFYYFHFIFALILSNSIQKKPKEKIIQEGKCYFILNKTESERENHTNISFHMARIGFSMVYHFRLREEHTKNYFLKFSFFAVYTLVFIVDIIPNFFFSFFGIFEKFSEYEMKNNFFIVWCT